MTGWPMQSWSIRTGKRTGSRNIWANTFSARLLVFRVRPLPSVAAGTESRVRVVPGQADRYQHHLRSERPVGNGLQGARHHMGQPQRLGRSGRRRPVRGQRHSSSGNHLSRGHHPRLVGRIRPRAPRATAENTSARLKRQRPGSCPMATSEPDYGAIGNGDISQNTGRIAHPRNPSATDRRRVRTTYRPNRRCILRKKHSRAYKPGSVPSLSRGLYHLSRPAVTRTARQQPTPRHRASNPTTAGIHGLATRETYWPERVATSAVGSYPAFSPLPSRPGRRSFSVTLLSPREDLPVRKRGALRCPDFPPLPFHE